MAVTAGSVLVAALSRDVDRLLAAEPDVRADVPDSVHQMRVAARRLRSVLRTYRPLLRRERVDSVRIELRSIGQVLGAARDAEVRAERLDRGLAALPDADVRGPVRDRLVDTQRRAYDAAYAAVVAELDSERYGALRESLCAIRDDPPLRRKAAKDAANIIPRLIRKERRRLSELIDAAAQAPPDHRVELLHDVRKAAKRLRYAAEAAAPDLGSATRIATAAKHVQSTLGDHRDAIESLQLIDATATAARDAGEDDHTYHHLAAAELAAAGEALDRYPATIGTLGKRRMESAS